MQSKFCLILPTLNERENVLLQINEVFSALPKIGKIIIVDDDSNDGTVEAIQVAFSNEIREGRVQVHVRKEDHGLTPSLRDGIRLSPLPWVGWMDCDLSMPVAALVEMLAKVEQGYDICIGTRFLAGGQQKKWVSVERDSRLEILLSSAINLSLRWVMRMPISDFTSGFAVGRTSILDSLEWRGRHGEYFIDVMAQAHRAGARLTEIPYTCGNRIHGVSKTAASLPVVCRNSLRFARSVLRVALSQRAEKRFNVPDSVQS